MCNNVKGFRWNTDIMHWVTSLSFHGGARALEIIRGKGCQGKESLIVDPKEWCLILPDVSSIKNHILPVDPYQELLPGWIQQLQNMLPFGKRVGGLVFDEIEIRAGLCYLKRTGRLIGFSTPVSERNIKTFLEQHKKPEERIAKKVFQVFFVSLDGTISLPLCFYPTTGASGQWVFSTVSTLLLSFKEYGIDIVWGSSDGFSGSSDFIKKMSTKFPQYSHIFDYVHVVKNLRNTLLNKVLKNSQCGSGFCMKTLWTLFEENSAYQSLLKIDDLAPSDKMALVPVKNLWKVLPELEKESSPDCYALLTFIKQMKTFYDVFDSPGITFQERIGKLIQVESFFSSWSSDPQWKDFSITSELEVQISTSLKSLQSIGSAYEKVFGVPLPHISYFGTNIVENYFSIIRSKIRYPNFFEYAYTSNRAWIELVKVFAKDRPYPMKSHHLSKQLYYNNQKGIVFSMKDVPFIAPSQKKKMTKALVTSNKGNFLLHTFLTMKDLQKKQKNASNLLIYTRVQESDCCFERPCARLIQFFHRTFMVVFLLLS